jgi:CheY-like chemotaxis protein
VRRAADLCQQLLMYTGRSDQSMGAVDMLALVREAIGLLRVTQVTNCEILCEFPPEPILVQGDRAQLLQIILNLVTNSSEAGATKVWFKAASVHRESPEPGAPPDCGDCIELCVTDNGAGMTPEVLARVFEPFFSTKFTGRGLGLPAALGIVRAHRGTMTVESKPGRGTNIRLQLPGAQRRDPAPPRPADEMRTMKSSRVALVADDEDGVRRSIVKCMGRLGWTTLEAADGEEAIRVHRDHSARIDLVLCDYVMPRVNGLEAALQMRRLNPKLRVVLMSGYTNDETTENFRANGFEHSLKKPFQIQELRELLEVAAGPGP